MDQLKILLIVDDPELSARYELILRFCGYVPVSLSSRAVLGEIPAGVVAACVLSDHRPSVDAICSKLLAAVIPIVRIDPFIRHGREHLPFDVVLPASSEPRRLITALRHLVPNGAYPA